MAQPQPTLEAALVATGYTLVDINPSGSHVLLGEMPKVSSMSSIVQHVVVSVDAGTPDTVLTQALHNALLERVDSSGAPEASIIGFVDDIRVAVLHPSDLVDFLNLRNGERQPVLERDRLERECTPIDIYFCHLYNRFSRLIVSPSGDVIVALMDELLGRNDRLYLLHVWRDGHFVGMYSALNGNPPTGFAFDTAEELLLVNAGDQLAIMPLRTTERQPIPWDAVDRAVLLGYEGEGSIAAIQDSQLLFFDRSSLQPTLPQQSGFGPPSMGLPEAKSVVQLGDSFPSEYVVAVQGRLSGTASNLPLLSFRIDDDLYVYDYVAERVFHTVDLAALLRGYRGAIRGDQVIVNSDGTRIAIEVSIPAPDSGRIPVVIVLRPK
jgi:hypothetical protein